MGYVCRQGFCTPRVAPVYASQLIIIRAGRGTPGYGYGTAALSKYWCTVPAVVDWRYPVTQNPGSAWHEQRHRGWGWGGVGRLGGGVGGSEDCQKGHRTVTCENGSYKTCTTSVRKHVWNNCIENNILPHPPPPVPTPTPHSHPILEKQQPQNPLNLAQKTSARDNDLKDASYRAPDVAHSLFWRSAFWQISYTCPAVWCTRHKDTPLKRRVTEDKGHLRPGPN